MEQKITTIRKFFDEDKDHKNVSQTLLELMEQDKPIPGHVFINLEQNKVSTQFRDNLVDLMKIKLLHTSDIANVSRLLTQLQFVLSLSTTK